MPSDYRNWPKARFPLAFAQIADTPPLPDDAIRLAVKDLPWSASSSKIRLYHFLKRFGPPGQQWAIDILHGHSETYLLVSLSRPRGKAGEPFNWLEKTGGDMGA